MVGNILGEYAWRDASEIELRKNSYAHIATPYTGIVETRTAEGSTEDNSVEGTFHLQLPSAGAMNILGLRLRSGRQPEYVDASGILRWQDPSLHTQGAGAGVVSRDYFLEPLAKAGLEPVWLLAGERSVFGSQDVGAADAFGGLFTTPRCTR
jgi:hypothetical protein